MLVIMLVSNTKLQIGRGRVQLAQKSSLFYLLLGSERCHDGEGIENVMKATGSTKNYYRLHVERI